MPKGRVSRLLFLVVIVSALVIIGYNARKHNHAGIATLLQQAGGKEE